MIKFKKIVFIFILFSLTGFKSLEKYKVIKKSMNDRQFYLAIPESFCEYKSPTDQVFQFVKCYEIELESEGLLSYFSERILLAGENDEKFLQNISNKLFAENQLHSYKKATKEEKKNYFFNKNYPYNNEEKATIIDDNFIYNRIAYDEDDSILQFLQSNLFLNKKLFIANWVQYLVDKEKPLMVSKNKFSKLIKKNQDINKNNDILLKINGNLNFLITKPKFDDFLNYTDIKEYNANNFSALYYNIFSKEKDKKDNKAVIVTLLKSDKDIKEVYDYSIKDKEKKNNTKLIHYKDLDIIKVSDKNQNSTRYGTYIDLYDDLKLFIVLKVDGVNNKESEKGIKYIYEYREQLINNNKENGRKLQQFIQL